MPGSCGVEVRERIQKFRVYVVIKVIQVGSALFPGEVRVKKRLSKCQDLVQREPLKSPSQSEMRIE